MIAIILYMIIAFLHWYILTEEMDAMRKPSTWVGSLLWPAAYVYPIIKYLRK